MITDDEQHDIADGLRRLAVCRHSTGVPDSEILDILEISCADIPNCSDTYDVERLADLIDIPTCVMTNVGGDFENSFQCSNCMNEFDMPDFDRYPYKRCPECGAVVLDAD